MHLRNESPTFLVARQLSREIPASSIPWRNTLYRETRWTDGFSLAYRKREGSRVYKQEGERGISLNRAIIDLRWYLVNTGGDVRSWPHTPGPHTATSPILLSSSLLPPPPSVFFPRSLPPTFPLRTGLYLIYNTYWSLVSPIVHAS